MPVDETPHRHLWATRSSHITSDGLLRYQWCACGSWQIVVAAIAGSQTAVATAGSRTPQAP